MNVFNYLASFTPTFFKPQIIPEDYYEAQDSITEEIMNDLVEESEVILLLQKVSSALNQKLLISSSSEKEFEEKQNCDVYFIAYRKNNKTSSIKVCYKSTLNTCDAKIRILFGIVNASFENKYTKNLLKSHQDETDVHKVHKIASLAEKKWKKLCGELMSNFVADITPKETIHIEYLLEE